MQFFEDDEFFYERQLNCPQFETKFEEISETNPIQIDYFSQKYKSANNLDYIQSSTMDDQNLIFIKQEETQEQQMPFFDYQCLVSPQELIQFTNQAISSDSIQTKINEYEKTFKQQFQLIKFQGTEVVTQELHQYIKLNKEIRKEKVDLYLRKKQKRIENQHKKQSYYLIRTKMAQTRLRKKGRFIKNSIN